MQLSSDGTLLEWNTCRHLHPHAHGRLPPGSHTLPHLSEPLHRRGGTRWRVRLALSGSPSPWTFKHAWFTQLENSHAACTKHICTFCQKTCSGSNYYSIMTIHSCIIKINFVITVFLYEHARPCMKQGLNIKRQRSKLSKAVIFEKDISAILGGY